MDSVKAKIDQMNLKRFGENKHLKFLSEKTSVPAEYFVLAFVAISTLLILFTKWGQCVLSLIFVFLYPAFKTFKARESTNLVERDRWLIYWTVFGFVFSLQTLISIFADFSINGIIVTVGLVATYSALTDGHAMIYDSVLRPLLVMHENTIDKYIQLAKDETADMAKRITREAVNQVTK